MHDRTRNDETFFNEKNGRKSWNESSRVVASQEFCCKTESQTGKLEYAWGGTSSFDFINNKFAWKQRDKEERKGRNQYGGDNVKGGERERERCKIRHDGEGG